MAIEVIVEPIAAEDINWKSGSKQSAETFTRTTSTGGSQLVHKISALTIPMEDEGNDWVPFDISTLEELILSWMNGTAPILNTGKMLQVKMGLDNSLAGLIGTDPLGKVVTELPWGFCMSMHPVGSIIPWMPGYFTGENETFVRASFLESELSEPSLVVACNAFLTQYGWHVCDGTAPNDADSPIWDAPGKKLPLLTDERFLMGVEGPVTIDEGEEWEETDVWAAGFNGHHVHGLQPVIMDAEDLPHTHQMWRDYSIEEGVVHGTSGASGLYSTWTGEVHLSAEQIEIFTHDHGLGGVNQVKNFEEDLLNGTSWESKGNGEMEMVGIDNRPKWLGVIYIIRIK